LFIDQLRTLPDRGNLRERAKKAGFVKRNSRLTAEAFMEMLLYCSSMQETSSLAFMASTLEDCGISISKQSLNERFNSSATGFAKAICRLYHPLQWLSVCHLRPASKGLLGFLF
jgi:hypothetical protein